MELDRLLAQIARRAVRSPAAGRCNVGRGSSWLRRGAGGPAGRAGVVRLSFGRAAGKGWGGGHPGRTCRYRTQPLLGAKIADNRCRMARRAAAALPGLCRGDGRERHAGGARGAAGMGRLRRLRRPSGDAGLDPAIADPLDRVVGGLPADARRGRRGGAGLLRRHRIRSRADRRQRAEVGRARPVLRGARSSRRSGGALLWNGLAAYVLERGRTAVRRGELPRNRRRPAGRGPVAPAPRASGAARSPGSRPARAVSRDEPDAARRHRGDPGAAVDPAADQGLPAARRVRRRGGLCRQRLQHHRRLRRHGHRPDEGALPAILPARPRAARLSGGRGRLRAGWNEVEPRRCRR